MSFCSVKGTCENMKREGYNLIVILGPTASGKTRLAAMLARDLQSEILSADSRQVYRGMDLGTGKDLSEFTVDGINIPHHLIDIVTPDYEFNVFEFQQRFFESYSLLLNRGVLPVMVGGTGLYIESVLREYRMIEVPENPGLRKEAESCSTEELQARLLAVNPGVHNTTDLIDRNRLIRAIEIAEYSRTHLADQSTNIPDIRPLIIGVKWDRAVLRQRITERLHKRIKAGMIDEVNRLHESGTSWEKLAFFGLEYRYISLYLKGDLSYGDMVKTLNTKIHQFAKRQETWFRRMERQGAIIHWIDGDDYDGLKKLVESMIDANDS